MWCVWSSCNVQKEKVTVLSSSSLSLESSNIAIWVLVMHCLLIEKQDAGMLASNANSSSPTMSHALQQVKAARIGVICQVASIAPQFLLARLQRYSFQLAIQLVFPSYTFTASLYLCPADCVQDILFEQAGNSHWHKLAFIKWHICLVGAWKYLT